MSSEIGSESLIWHRHGHAVGGTVMRPGNRSAPAVALVVLPRLNDRHGSAAGGTVVPHLAVHQIFDILIRMVLDRYMTRNSQLRQFIFVYKGGISV
ncbi:hypothetical protein HanRHA438_Chr10g0442691 [Helianthus annuus]|nr:hypothetical protein HanRHA438_Chr10g0442691 [Helianthus annuus]